MSVPIRKFLVFFALLAIASCKLDSDKKVNREKFKFKVGVDASLFFRNVRQIYYDRYSPDGKWQAYRFGDRTTEGTYINPVVVINWIKDEAYLLIETSDDLSEVPFLSVRINHATAESDTIILKDRGKEKMLEFGSCIYEAIQQQDSLKVLLKGKYVHVFSTEEDRENFRIPMSDYYRLTAIF